MKILADSSLPGLRDAFPLPFEITLYHHNDEVVERLNDHEILLCRSTLTVDEKLLKSHSLRYVATASSGTDHIDATFLSTQNIKLLDAKGSNANAVADYVVSIVAFLQKYTTFNGDKAGIIGLGHVGTAVAARLRAMNFDLITYDPPRGAQENDFKNCSLEEIMACDLICIHANLHDNQPWPSRDLITEKELALIKPNAAIINAARGGIVSEEALLKASTSFFYSTDVYCNEPAINEAVVGRASLCTPHIAGHSLEAKANAVAMLSEKLHRCYQLPLPHYPSLLVKEEPLFKADATWEDYILSLYNPLHETIALKEATNIKEIFLQLRKAHQNRHDFCVYDKFIVDETLRPLLGLAAQK
ncbi:MAG: 4-phosphoerythronate dehydrogenase [Legionella sp.]|nr:4-phosphoerythronate dehydrogenase [Legionella sp.]